MARKAFYSFHYDADSWRAGTIRNIGVVEGNQPARDNDWEQIKRGGDNFIMSWIEQQLYGTSVTIVLIGTETAGRKWINYEIKRSWEVGNGILGIYIHNMKDALGNSTFRGQNPFSYTTVISGQLNVAPAIPVYDLPADSKLAYAHIQNNLSYWIEEAISFRNRYAK